LPNRTRPVENPADAIDDEGLDPRGVGDRWKKDRHLNTHRIVPKQSLLLLSLLTTPISGLPHPLPSPAEGTSADRPAHSTVEQDTMRTLQRSGRIVKLAGLIDHAERLHPGRPCSTTRTGDNACACC